VVLFRRTSKGLELTDEAESGLDPLREGFLRFEESVEAMQAGQASSRYAIAVPREFHARWLAPRLTSFRAENPEARFTLIAEESADFTEANLDLAIRLTEGPGDLEGMQLAPGERVMVAAPGIASDAGWISWPGFPLPEDSEVVLQVSNAEQALSSALAGLGRAMMPVPLVSALIEQGALEAIGAPQECRRAYWLVAPLPQWRQKKVRALVAKLMEK